MDLWIRSQKNSSIAPVLLSVRHLELREADTYNIVADNLYFVGKYETKERALEVLDEIEETLCLDKLNYEDIDRTCYQDCCRYKSDIIAVYDMPIE